MIFRRWSKTVQTMSPPRYFIVLSMTVHDMAINADAQELHARWCRQAIAHAAQLRTFAFPFGAHHPRLRACRNCGYDGRCWWN